LSEQQPAIENLVTEEQARKSEPIVPQPDSLALEEIKNNHAKNMAGLHRGVIGWCVGSGPEKAGNVATLTIIASFLLIVCAFFKFDFSAQFDFFYKILTTLLGPIGLALGYLFGSKGEK
jgi:hypothetical protein